VSCWLAPAASQIPVQSWAARETSSHPVVWESPQVMYRLTVPSRRAIACTMPSGSAGQAVHRHGPVLPAEVTGHRVVGDAVNGGALGRGFSVHGW
jgi:hypothetical protein